MYKPPRTIVGVHQAHIDYRKDWTTTVAESGVVLDNGVDADLFTVAGSGLVLLDIFIIAFDTPKRWKQVIGELEAMDLVPARTEHLVWLAQWEPDSWPGSTCVGMGSVFVRSHWKFRKLLPLRKLVPYITMQNDKVLLSGEPFKSIYDAGTCFAAIVKEKVEDEADET